jgi:hypothetical protein
VVSQVAFEDAILALREYWTDVMDRLDDRSRADLIRLLDRLDGTDRPRASAMTADFLVEKLPRDHPVRRALVSGTMFAPATLDWPDVLESFRQLSAAERQGLVVPAPAATVVREVTARLLRQPALTEEEVRDLGLDPADPGLIRLRRADGRYQWPSFQFAPSELGPVSDVVRRVNKLLGANSDPIGAADWWLSRNDWLGEAPCRLLGQIADHLLIEAAQAVVAEV